MKIGTLLYKRIHYYDMPLLLVLKASQAFCMLFRGDAAADFESFSSFSRAVMLQQPRDLSLLLFLRSLPV